MTGSIARLLVGEGGAKLDMPWLMWRASAFFQKLETATFLSHKKTTKRNNSFHLPREAHESAHAHQREGERADGRVSE